MKRCQHKHVVKIRRFGAPTRRPVLDAIATWCRDCGALKRSRWLRPGKVRVYRKRPVDRRQTRLRVEGREL